MDNTQTKAAGTGIRAAGKTSLCRPDYTAESLPLEVVKDISLVDSRILAAQLGVKHRSTFALIQRYAPEFQAFDQLRFKNAVGERIQGGNAERYALLSEDQAVFLLTLSRNSERVVPLKARLVQAFRRARDGVELGKDYLPGYHDLHDEVKRLAEAAQAAGSAAPERVFHMNMNKLVNNALGLAPGQRGSLTPQRRMAVISAGFVVQKAIERTLASGGDHHAAHAEAKAQVNAYARGAALLLRDG